MRISVIIPTWCEAVDIGDTVAHAAWADEVIVADARSPDGTADEARRAGALVVEAGKGRGSQLRAGAAIARGDVLLFLHADARLEEGAHEAIVRALDQPHVVGGNFYIRFAPRSVAADVFTFANDWRRRLLRTYYGDSAIFVRRSAYEALGGFRDLPLFEDYEFARRLERLGPTSYVRDVAVIASSRRFDGVASATLFLWCFLQVAYSAGVSADRLAALYKDARVQTRLSLPPPSRKAEAQRPR